MKYLLFGTNVYGHNMEYIHHVYMKFVSTPEHELSVAVPSIFQDNMSLMDWPKVSNISFTFFEEIPSRKPLIDAYNAARLLKNLCRKERPDQVLLVVLMYVMPFIAFILPQNVKISGIIYNIYLYRWKTDSWLRNLQDVLIYSILSRFKLFNRIFILNDNASARLLNRIWKTDKFLYLPDPCMAIPKDSLVNIRKQFGIHTDKTVFLHMGSITRRKGALDVFRIISSLPDNIRNNYCFIFAGRVWEDVKDDFYDLFNAHPKDVQVLVFDKFCSYGFLGSLCISSDFILLPYYNTCNSSGIISYGAQFGCPVIVRANGMVSKLVRKYHMGLVLDGDFVSNFVDNISKIDSIQCSAEYLTFHTIEQFQNIYTNIK